MINIDVSEERLSRFFTKEDRGYCVMPDIRSSVVSTVQDILADPPFSRIDMVSCRNLLIYLKPEAQTKARGASRRSRNPTVSIAISGEAVLET